MFQRKLESGLDEWGRRKGRRPLILRGARQTGKTTLVRHLGQKFDSFLELNLEQDNVRKIFSTVGDLRSLIQSIEGIKGEKVEPGKTLLFLDEIQNSVEAIRSLRFFFEEMPGLHVIAAGSLLEVRMRKEGWSFPVGRVEFLYLYPVSFEEFLEALDEKKLLENLREVSCDKPLPQPLHEKSLDLLCDYLVVGGMPAAVEEYRNSRSFIPVKREHDILLTTLKEDFRRYATVGETKYLKAVWDLAPYKIGQRVKYSEFGEHRSSAISQAFDILHEAMLLERVSPTSRVRPPLVKKEKAAPKILGLDIGLSLSQLGLTKDQVKGKLLAADYEGGIWEAFVGQEIQALQSTGRTPLFFWVREEKEATSELDYLLPLNGKLIPIEVKAGSHGSLRSLHQFLARSGAPEGLRLYHGQLDSESHVIHLPDQRRLKYRLLSLPLYLTFRIFDFSFS